MTKRRRKRKRERKSRKKRRGIKEIKESVRDILIHLLSVAEAVAKKSIAANTLNHVV
jgi:hypothetical protein